MGGVRVGPMTLKGIRAGSILQASEYQKINTIPKTANCYLLYILPAKKVDTVTIVTAQHKIVNFCNRLNNDNLNELLACPWWQSPPPPRTKTMVRHCVDSLLSSVSQHHLLTEVELLILQPELGHGLLLGQEFPIQLKDGVPVAREGVAGPVLPQVYPLLPAQISAVNFFIESARRKKLKTKIN